MGVCKASDTSNGFGTPGIDKYAYAIERELKEIFKMVGEASCVSRKLGPEEGPEKYAAGKHKRHIRGVTFDHREPREERPAGYWFPAQRPHERPILVELRAERNPRHRRPCRALSLTHGRLQHSGVGSGGACLRKEVVLQEAPRDDTRAARARSSLLYLIEDNPPVPCNVAIVGDVKLKETSTGWIQRGSVGLRAWKFEKKGPLSRVAVGGLENIETVHEPKPIQAAGALCMDRVAVLWSVPAAHRPRQVKGPMPSSDLRVTLSRYGPDTLAALQCCDAPGRAVVRHRYRFRRTPQFGGGFTFQQLHENLTNQIFMETLPVRSLLDATRKRKRAAFHGYSEREDLDISSVHLLQLAADAANTPQLIRIRIDNKGDKVPRLFRGSPSLNQSIVDVHQVDITRRTNIVRVFGPNIYVRDVLRGLGRTLVYSRTGPLPS
ncbi:hypothetical protein FB451DRAFT_1177891 [Mycena latifolia]|nr:hypothetical protein FB451DRAFT_1177891 [Mycena latifolia]